MYQPYQMSHVARKPAIGIAEQIRHKPAFAATEAANAWLEILDSEIRGIILSEKGSIKKLIGLCIYAD